MFTKVAITKALNIKKGLPLFLVTIDLPTLLPQQASQPSYLIALAGKTVINLLHDNREHTNWESECECDVTEEKAAAERGEFEIQR